MIDVEAIDRRLKTRREAERSYRATLFIFGGVLIALFARQEMQIEKLAEISEMAIETRQEQLARTPAILAVSDYARATTCQ